MNRICVLLLVSTLASCQAVPGDGPLAGSILSDAGKSADELGRKTATVYEIVDVDSESAEKVSAYTNGPLNRRFGLGSGRVARATIGVGDRLIVSIFEAGENGLFSTSKSKSANIEIVVQPDGKGSLPYVGAVQFAGLTLEQARQEIVRAFEGKAVEPDVIIQNTDTASRKAVVTGAVNRPSVIPLNLAGERLTDVIAKAGGPRGEAYDTFVTVTRGRKSATALVSAVIENPGENIWVQPGDEITLVQDPRQFTIMGAVVASGRGVFGSRDLSLIEAVGLGRGGSDYVSNQKGFFVFRYEEPDVAAAVLGRTRYVEMLRQGLRPDAVGRVPMVYRLDMSRPDSLLAGQKFSVKHRDIIYVSRHLSTDIAKFVGIVGQPLQVANSGVSVVHQAANIASD